MLHYDTCVYDPDTLSHLVGIVGAERIVMGSDYPVGDTTPIEFVTSCAALDKSGKDAVLRGNAERLLAR
jgi:aminocarboxymuconate-semialdehyde decarboxylase